MIRTNPKEWSQVRFTVFAPGGWGTVGLGAALAAFLSGLALSPGLYAQSSDDFVPLFDGRSLDGWIVENSDGENFSVHDGALRVEEPEGWLRTEREYRDFDLRLEFRFLTDGADSGVFVRAASLATFARGWPNESYQVQLRDMHQPSRFLPLGQIYRHGMPDGETEYDEAAVSTAFQGVGEWHALEIEARGNRLTVTLDGTPVTLAENIANPAGYLGFQGETGIVEYRSIEIREQD